MENQKITFLLGAGASHGHLPTGCKTPPIMNNFFSSSVTDHILTKKDFPALADYICHQSNNTETLFESCKSVESHWNLENFLGNVNDGWILHLGLFYIVKYLGYFCNQPISNESAYLLLANYIKSYQEKMGGIINLNYDILCDQALKKCDVQTNYGFSEEKSSTLIHTKPHGSLNFRFHYSRIVRMDCNSWQDFVSRKNKTILGIKVNGIPIEFYEPKFDFKKDFLNKGILKYIPTIVMPIGKNKKYQFDTYSSIWGAIQSILNQTTELIVIGCAINDDDTLLWQHLNNLKKTTIIKIVSKSKKDAETIALKFFNKNFKNVISVDVNGFYEYARNYLSKGKT